MKIYKTQSEVEKDIKNGVLAIEGDVKFECSISISASIVVNAWDITAWDINARDITARDITAWDINARDITARDINAWDIKARNINARDINARDINARDINARDITAGDISYYAFCCVYENIECTSIKARRTPSQEPICLDGKLEIINEEKSLSGKTVKVELNGISYEAVIK